MFPGENNLFRTGGSNSAGRVRPCQGRCRGFESRLPLQKSAMKTLFLALALAIFPVFAQEYKVEPIASPAPALASSMQTEGYRVTGPSGPWCEVWFAKSIPTGGKPSDAAVTFGIPQ